MPLNCNASPYLPDVDHVAPEIVPLLSFPEASVTVVPDPSSNAYAATRPEDVAAASPAAAPPGRLAAAPGWLPETDIEVDARPLPFEANAKAVDMHKHAKHNAHLRSIRVPSA